VNAQIDEPDPDLDIDDDLQFKDQQPPCAALIEAMNPSAFPT